MDEAIKQAVVDALEGTCRDEGFAAEKFDLTTEQIESIMAESGFERCPECDWWVECWELVDEDNELKSCDSCDPRRNE